MQAALDQAANWLRSHKRSIKRRQTKLLGVVDEVHVHLERVSDDEDVGSELLVQSSDHLDERRVEYVGGLLGLRCALPVLASLRG